MYILTEGSSYPILALEGVAGSSKSTLTKQIRQLIDPRKPIVQAMPRNISDFYLTAHHTHLIALDNVSKINQDLSDILCGIATGTGFSKRELYSDSGEVYYEIRKPIVLNSINSVMDYSDLADRSIRLSLPSISSQTTLSNAAGEETLPHHTQNRLSDEKVDELFQSAAPKILGALFTAIQVALPGYKNVTDLPNEIRMMDFAQWGVAASKAFATTNNIDFVSILMANRRHSSKPMLEDSILNSVLLKFMQAKMSWSGTATDLIQELSKLINANEAMDRTFPKRANQLTKELNQSITTLKQFGIHYQHSAPNNHNQRTITLQYTPDSNENADGSIQDDTVENAYDKTQDTAIGMKGNEDMVSTRHNLVNSQKDQANSKLRHHSNRVRHSAHKTTRVRPTPIKPEFPIDFDED